jgi:hypothetical protein
MKSKHFLGDEIMKYKQKVNSFHPPLVFLSSLPYDMGYNIAAALKETMWFFIGMIPFQLANVGKSSPVTRLYPV